MQLLIVDPVRWEHAGILNSAMQSSFGPKAEWDSCCVQCPVKFKNRERGGLNFVDPEK